MRSVFLFGVLMAQPIPMNPVTTLGTETNTVPATVLGVATLPDGAVALTCADQKVRIWEPASGNIRAEHALPQDVISSAGAAIGSTVALVVRFPAQGVLLFDAKNPGSIRPLADSLKFVKEAAAGGRTLALLGDNQGSKVDPNAPAESIVELWDLSGAPKKLASIRAATTQDSGAAAFSAVAVSGDGKLVAIGSHDGRIAVREAATQRPVAEWKAHDRFVETIAFSPDGMQLVSADDGSLAWWNATTGANIRSAYERGHQPGLVWSPDGTQVLDGQNLVSAADGTRRALEGFEDRAYGSAFLADGKRVAFGGIDSRVRVFDRATAKEIAPAGTHRRAVRAISFSKDGGRIATAGGDGAVLLFETQSGKPIAAHESDTTSGPHQGTNGLGILADGTIVSGGASGAHRLDGKGGVAPAWNKTSPVEALAVSPDRTRVALGDGAILDTSSGAEVARFTRVTAILSLAFSADGALLATGTTNDDARLIDAKTGAVKATRKHSGWVKAVAVSPAGQLTSAASGERKIKLSDGFFGGKSIATPSDAVSLAWNPDGTRLAAAAGSAHIYDASGRLVATLPQTAGARAVAFSPDGSLLAVGLANGTTTLFRAP